MSKTSSKGGKGCSKTSLMTFTFDLKTCFKSTAHHLQTGILFVKHINKISGNIKAKWKRKYDSKQKCFRVLLGPWPLTWSQGKGNMLRASKVGMITKGDMQSRTLIKTTARDGLIKKKTYAKQNYVWIYSNFIYSKEQTYLSLKYWMEYQTWIHLLQRWKRRKRHKTN